MAACGGLDLPGGAAAPAVAAGALLGRGLAPALGGDGRVAAVVGAAAAVPGAVRGVPAALAAAAVAEAGGDAAALGPVLLVACVAADVAARRFARDTPAPADGGVAAAPEDERRVAFGAWPAARALAAKRSRSAAEDGELRAALNFGVAAGGLHVGDVVDRSARTLAPREPLGTLAAAVLDAERRPPAAAFYCVVDGDGALVGTVPLSTVLLLVATRAAGRGLCGIRPLVRGVPTKLQNSRARPNRSRFG